MSAGSYSGLEWGRLAQGFQPHDLRPDAEHLRSRLQEPRDLFGPREAAICHQSPGKQPGNADAVYGDLRESDDPRGMASALFLTPSLAGSDSIQFKSGQDTS